MQFDIVREQASARSRSQFSHLMGGNGEMQRWSVSVCVCDVHETNKKAKWKLNKTLFRLWWATTWWLVFAGCSILVPRDLLTTLHGNTWSRSMSNRATEDTLDSKWKRNKITSKWVYFMNFFPVFCVRSEIRFYLYFFVVTASVVVLTGAIFPSCHRIHFISFFELKYNKIPSAANFWQNRIERERRLNGAPWWRKERKKEVGAQHFQISPFQICFFQVHFGYFQFLFPLLIDMGQLSICQHSH